ncbi:hypothetical protein [Caballeronia sp. INDeC2]|uniref:hypothetical protein n=1 Tax=Caballeronia sp. INDeC2 TaxID=2921747 RepID=UPI002027DD0D|nr:hypothetical protein [Caballeronia sp. INDeC2]
MNKRQLMRMTREIVLIRNLQRERALHDAKRAAHEHQGFLVSEQDLGKALDAQRAFMREIFAATNSTLRIELAANVRASVESAHVNLLVAQKRTVQAAGAADAHRTIYADRERLHELADTLADRASSACAKADEVRQSDLIEDTFRARGRAR